MATVAGGGGGRRKYKNQDIQYKIIPEIEQGVDWTRT